MDSRPTAVAGYVSAPVPCAGCDTQIPYEVSDTPHAERSSYGEWLKTPLGLTYVRTCWRRSCVLEARRRREGRRTTPPKSRDTVHAPAPYDASHVNGHSSSVAVAAAG